MNSLKGILWAALSSSTFGLAPLFTLLLLGVGYSSCEVLAYRWGVASICLIAFGALSGRNFKLSRDEWKSVLLLSLFRATTSFSLVIAYQNIASGVASTIHFMYPLAVALAMICFFRERGSVRIFLAVALSIVGGRAPVARKRRVRPRKYHPRSRCRRRLGILLWRLHRRRAPKPRRTDRLPSS